MYILVYICIQKKHSDELLNQSSEVKFQVLREHPNLLKWKDVNIQIGSGISCMTLVSVKKIFHMKQNRC